MGSAVPLGQPKMTLKLVTDNSNVVQLNTVNLVDELTRMARDIEADAETVVTITLGNGWSQMRVFGEQMSNYSLMGIFEAAKFEALSDMIEGSE